MAEDHDPGFADREREFNQSIGGTIAGFAVAAVNADSAAKDAALARTIELLKRPNVDFTASVDVIGIEQTLETRVSVPVVSVVKANPIVVEEAKISMDMNVSEHAENNLSVKSDTTITGSAALTVGPFFKASMGMKSTIGVSNDRKRSSDYTATTHAELTMKQAEPAEGLSKIIDMMVSFSDTAMQINQALVEKQAQKAIESDVVQDPEKLPEALPEPDKKPAGGGGE